MDQLLQNKITQFAQWILESKRTVFFGGAGVSTESGIPDFRSKDGLYSQKYKVDPETILSDRYFWTETEIFYEFYRDKMIHLQAKPNLAHRTLAKMEENGLCECVITQNIDGLHQMAGSKNVLELHGSIHRNFCQVCKKEYGLDAMICQEGIPRCDCGNIIKPDVVLYGESLDQDVLEQSIKKIEFADLLIIGGTSLRVYPAAGLLEYFKGKHLVIINKDQTRTPGAGLYFQEPIGQLMDLIWKEIRQK